MCPYTRYLGLKGVPIWVLYGLSTYYMGTWSLWASECNSKGCEGGTTKASQAFAAFGTCKEVIARRSGQNPGAENCSCECCVRLFVWQRVLCTVHIVHHSLLVFRSTCCDRSCRPNRRNAMSSGRTSWRRVRRTPVKTAQIGAA